MKIPFLSDKAEQTVNRAVEVAGEKVKDIAGKVTEEKISTVALLLPIGVAALMIFSNKKAEKAAPVPTKIIINNHYYYARRTHP